MQMTIARRRVWAVAAALALAPTGRAYAQSAAGAAPGQAAPRAYVANQDGPSVSIVDTGSHTMVETVDLEALGFGANAKPHHTAVEPDGSHWYVSLIGAGKVLKFDRANNLVGQADFEVPGMLAMHPTRDLLFVGRSMSAVNPPQRIGIIQRSDMSIEEVGVFIARPHALVVDPRGTHVYTASMASNRIASYDIDQGDLELTTLTGPHHAFVQFAMSSDGRRLIGTGHLTGKLVVFDTTNPMAPVVLHAVSVGRAPWHPVYTPDGREVYVGNQLDNTVSVVDTEQWEVTHLIRHDAFAQPHGAAVTPDGRYVYISNRNVHDDHGGMPTPASEVPGRVVIVDTETHQVVEVVETGPYAAGMSISAR